MPNTAPHFLKSHSLSTMKRRPIRILQLLYNELSRQANSHEGVGFTCGSNLWFCSNPSRLHPGNFSENWLKNLLRPYIRLPNQEKLLLPLLIS